MKPDYENRLEAEIDRVLKELPELSAPASLQGRVLAAIERRAALPWYRQSWQMWPLSLRVASFVALLAPFAAICVAGWLVPQTGEYTTAAHTVGGWLSSVNALLNVVGVLLGAILAAVKQLGSTVLIACLVGLGLGYATCVGLGTFYVRLAMARR